MWTSLYYLSMNPVFWSDTYIEDVNQFPCVRVPHFDGEVTDCCYHQRVIHVPRNHCHSKSLDIFHIILVCAKIWNLKFSIVNLLHVHVNKCLSKTVLFQYIALYLLYTNEVFSFSFKLHYCSDILMFRIFDICKSSCTSPMLCSCKVPQPSILVFRISISWLFHPYSHWQTCYHGYSNKYCPLCPETIPMYMYLFTSFYFKSTCMYTLKSSKEN